MCLWYLQQCVSGDLCVCVCKPLCHGCVFVCVACVYFVCVWDVYVFVVCKATFRDLQIFSGIYNNFLGSETIFMDPQIFSGI